MKTHILALLLLALAAGAMPLTAAPSAGYKLAWSDEFNGAALDTNVWHYRTGARLLSFQSGKLTHLTDATKFSHGPQSVWLTCVGALWGKPTPPKAMDDSAMPACAEFDWVRVYELGK